jgi:MoaA/NifB/PqqE/SkfB family radical SAM enzyme
MKKSKEETLCTQLWNHPVVDLSQKKFRVCCKTQPNHFSDVDIKKYKEDLFLNHPIFVAQRETMLQNGKPECCNVCWKLEKEGSFSFRNGPEAWNIYFSSRLLPSSDPRLSSFPNNLDIQLDNYCDLKCIYCNEEFSSQWQAEKLKFGETIPARSGKVDLELEKNFFKWFDKVKMNFERIAFLGGEPLISPIFYDYFFKILNSYEDVFPDRLEFNIITNLNTPAVYFEKFLKLVREHHKNVKFNINISMESWGEKAEIIRSNINFERFKNNFELLASLPRNVQISTITSLNIFCISSIYEYLEFVTELETRHNRDIIIYPNLINFPDWLSVALVPKNFYELYIKKCISLLQSKTRHLAYVDFLKGLENKFQFEILKNTPVHKQLIQETKKLDSRREISFKKSFDEYGYLWQKN